LARLIGPHHHRVDVLEQGLTATQRLLIESRDPLAVGVVWLVLDSEAPGTREPIFCEPREPAADVIDEQVGGAIRRFYEHESIIERLLQRRANYLSVVSAQGCRPGVQRGAERTGMLQLVQRPRHAEEVALAIRRDELYERQQPAHGFVARPHQLV